MRLVRLGPPAALLMLLGAERLWALPIGAAGDADVGRFLFILGIMLIAGKISGEAFERLGQPAVVGELVAGVILGMLTPSTPWLEKGVFARTVSDVDELIELLFVRRDVALRDTVQIAVGTGEEDQDLALDR